MIDLPARFILIDPIGLRQEATKQGYEQYEMAKILCYAAPRVCMRKEFSKELGMNVYDTGMEWKPGFNIAIREDELQFFKIEPLLAGKN